MFSDMLISLIGQHFDTYKQQQDTWNVVVNLCQFTQYLLTDCRFIFNVKYNRMILLYVVFISALMMMMAGSDHGLMSLYKDMESCGEYTDIKVMWEMIHSSCHPKAHNTRSKKPYWKFCFRPTWIMPFVSKEKLAWGELDALVLFQRDLIRRFISVMRKERWAN